MKALNYMLWWYHAVNVSLVPVKHFFRELQSTSVIFIILNNGHKFFKWHLLICFWSSNHNGIGFYMTHSILLYGRKATYKTVLMPSLSAVLKHTRNYQLSHTSYLSPSFRGNKYQNHSHTIRRVDQHRTSILQYILLFLVSKFYYLIWESV